MKDGYMGAVVKEMIMDDINENQSNLSQSKKMELANKRWDEDYQSDRKQYDIKPFSDCDIAYTKFKESLSERENNIRIITNYFHYAHRLMRELERNEFVSEYEMGVVQQVYDALVYLQMDQLLIEGISEETINKVNEWKFK